VLLWCWCRGMCDGVGGVGFCLRVSSVMTWWRWWWCGFAVLCCGAMRVRCDTVR